MQINGINGSMPTNALPIARQIQNPKIYDSSSPSTPSTSASSSSSAASPAQADTQDFITILTAELQSQDPTNPVDPTNFVTQLAQFNSLDELINIRADIEAYTSSAASASGNPVLPNPPSTQNPNSLF